MLSVDGGLLLAARRWSPEERRDMESHPLAGVQMLRSIEVASKVNEIILGHHEHWDGRGYPRGLSHGQIPLAARVLAVVDAYEAMTAGRPYREPYGEEEAIAELKRCAGTQFDPAVVEQFCRMLAEDLDSAELDAAPGGTPTAPEAPQHTLPAWRPDAVR
jgi:HD-GYP domain-containing protein (c-di-GMP phosphodiesterase class II)